MNNRVIKMSERKGIKSIASQIASKKQNVYVNQPATGVVIVRNSSDEKFPFKTGLQFWVLSRKLSSKVFGKFEAFY